MVWGGSSFADAGPQTSPAFLLVTGKGALTGVSGGTTFVPRACQGWSLGLLGEAHAVPVQLCPPGRAWRERAGSSGVASACAQASEPVSRGSSHPARGVQLLVGSDYFLDTKS